MSELVVEGDSPPWTLTDRLRKAREHRGLEQKDLASLIGVAPRSIVNYETGRTTPRRPQLIAWAMATGVSLSWLEGPDAARPKGLEPLTFWSGVWRAQSYTCARCGWPSWEWLCPRCKKLVEGVRADDLALTA